MRQFAAYFLLFLLYVLAGCSLLGSTPPATKPVETGRRNTPIPVAVPVSRANDVTMFALGLIDTGYRFGGKNPDAGLDCSGMVSYVFANAADLKLAGSAADIARHGRPIGRDELRPGDLVFFNTRNRPYSHVGIYIGDDRFVHAPNSTGKVRTDTLSRSWYATRFEEARTYFD